MNPVDEFLEGFRQRSAFPREEPGRELWFSLAAAADILAELPNVELALLGIDGVVLKGTEIHVRLDKILDVSGACDCLDWPIHVTHVGESAANFLRVIADPEQEVVVSFVLETRDEWEERRARST